MIPKDELCDLYYNKQMTQSEIGELYVIVQQDVSYLMKKYGIKSRSRSEANLGRPQQCSSSKPSKKDLEEMYRGNNMHPQEIGELYGVSKYIVRRWLVDDGIEIRTMTEAQLVNSSGTKPSKKYLEEMYLGRDMNTREIGELCSVTQVTICNWMRDYGIEARTNGDFTGEKSGGWKGGISGGKYCYKFNNRFKESIRKRDNYTCQLCGLEQNGRKLSVHHIYYDKENCYPDVITLCRSCNSVVNADRDSWERFFEDQLEQRGLLQ